VQVGCPLCANNRHSCACAVFLGGLPPLVSSPGWCRTRTSRRACRVGDVERACCWGRQDLSVVTAKGRTLFLYALPANSIKELYAGYRADDGAVDELVGQAQKLHPQLSTFECHLDDSTLSVGFNNMFLLQRCSERNTTEGSIHGNANNAPNDGMKFRTNQPLSRGQLTKADATRAGRIPNWQMRHRSSGR
jgi:hypothetical protein